MSEIERLDNFLLVLEWCDKIYVGLNTQEDWPNTSLIFSNAQEALAVRTHWKLWIAGLVE